MRALVVIVVMISGLLVVALGESLAFSIQWNQTEAAVGNAVANGAKTAGNYTVAGAKSAGSYVAKGGSTVKDQLGHGLQWLGRKIVGEYKSPIPKDKVRGTVNGMLDDAIQRGLDKAAQQEVNLDVI